MKDRTVARITGWDHRNVGDGRIGLSKLADAGFSGAVDAGDVWLLVLNGRIVGTDGRSLESIGTGDSLAAYTAPHPALPLLFAMQERGGDTQGRYFTDDTPLAEVHETLSSGAFTGYTELSENVHSGDYYVVYYGGRALFAAFVGSAERLVTGEDAFERANDEVGIYEVTSVDLDVRTPPEDATRNTGSGPATGASVASGAAGDDAGGGTTDPAADPAAKPGGPSPDPGTGDGSVPDQGRDTGGYAVRESVEGLRDPDPDAARRRSRETGSDDPESGSAGDPDSGRTPAGGGDDPTPNTSTPGTDAATGVGGGRSRGRAGTNRDETAAGGRSGDVDGGIPWADGRTVPALDPERTAVPADGGNAGPARIRNPSGGGDAKPGSNASSGGVAAERVAELEAEIEELRDRIDSLSEERDRLAEERDRLAEERDRLSEEHDRATAERDRLAEERDDLETRLEDLLAEQQAEREDLTPGEALADTDLFVRYDSKSQSTLSEARDGDASAETVGANLRLETHTRFDAGTATVDGEEFESFLRGTLPYRFVTWLTGEFLFEIRDTGNETTLRDLYDALPEIDRVEFDETVTSRDADGEELSATFDVVVRDQMGEPLVLADVDEGRDPTDGRMMAELLDRATRVAEAEGSVAGVFLITASFFDNDVHEEVRDATKTGFLDRDSRRSFVKTSRNDGYHACLVEARSDRFHLSRPDL
jgi:FtsZ-binding cell division protein ZapB